MNWKSRNAAFLPKPGDQTYARMVEETKNRQHSKGVAVSGTRKTKTGATVKRPPSTRPVRSQITEARALFVEVFEEAEKHKALLARMNEPNPVDTNRFPVLGGQS